MSFYVKDFAVIPAYQSKGVGSALMDAVEEYIRKSIPKEWAVSLELISTKEAVPFYKKKGFYQVKCLRCGTLPMPMLLRESTVNILMQAATL